MPAGQHNLNGDQIIEAGSTYDKSIPVVDDLAAGLDFTGYTTGMMLLRLTVDSTGPPILSVPMISEAAADAGTTGFFVETGIVRIVIAAADSAAISFDSEVALTDNRTGVYQLEVYNGSIAWRVLEGTYQISPEAVREDDGAP